MLMGNNSEKLFKTLSGENEDLSGGDEAEIIVAEDLSPSETVQMDKSRVRSFVTRLGSANSHTAILARTMNIPALIGIDYEEDIDGKTAVVDGFQGTLIVDPDSETLLKYVKKEEEERIKQELRNEDIPYHEMELGADLTLTDTFLDMGIDELSVSPSRILSIRKKVREHQ